MRSRITRRAVLLGIVGLFGASWQWRRWRRPSAGDLAGLLRSRLAHVDFEPDAVDRFAAEYVRRFGAQSMSVHHRETFGGLLRHESLRRLLPAARRDRVTLFERHLVSYCLRSTDYFTVGRTRSVGYVAFADPYEIGCANPLANLDPPPDSGGALRRVAGAKDKR